MGFLSRLIGKKKNSSYVRAWVQKAWAKKNTKWGTPQDLFAGMIYYLKSFGEDGLGGAAYSGDASLFEIACYFFFYTDLWLFDNKPNYRHSVSLVFFQELAKLFSDALDMNMNKVSELIVDRLEKYGEVVRKNNAVESYHALLIDLVRRTKYNAPPQKYNLNSPRIGVIDPHDDFILLKMYLIIFEENMLTAYLQGLKNFLDYVDQDK